ncbi:hypothetical protein [Paraburkholderia sp. J63]|nr:hypothetical protein [Paraburkholderia sp. J63]
MSDLLSRSEYQKIARDLKLPAAVVDGRACGASGRFSLDLNGN